MKITESYFWLTQEWIQRLFHGELEGGPIVSVNVDFTAYVF